ncbi:hypothetical protein [Hymenobacter convexus]|uniref:hypothetical protein n=1 Tax=Hymenobacter sp. CA1UV-4 TaxID=3063782 RepID=UPI00271410FE|nr:hypothetical protein [Hymenobacter sp. CA1UV-4]MDO7852755.1 hypothetical protein [Hymenobacter sp. CA1UV-4]
MKNFCLNLWSRVGLTAVATLALNACAPGQDTPTPTIGVNVSRYLAVGDSYTAGLSAGGLTLASQEYSFPNLLAQQLRGAQADATFSQPLLPAGAGSGYFNLVDFTALGFPRTRRVPGPAVRRQVINPAACGGADTVRLLTRTDAPNTLPQNLGVPGLRLGQIEVAGLGNETTNATPTGNFNPYFERLLPAADPRTYLQAVTDAAAPATFFTYFMGLDEVLVYVRSGGECGPTLNTAYNTLLKNNAKKVLDKLTAGGRPGIIARLPDLNTLPLLRLGQGRNLEKRLQTSFADTASLYIQDPFGTVGMRITDASYVLATTIPRIGRLTPVVVGTTTLMLPYGRDIRNPIRDADVMDYDEMSRINDVVSRYNTALNDLATTTYKMPIIDSSTKSSTLDLNVAMPDYVGSAISVGGVLYSAEPVRGNFFSLDYYTPTPRGNALIANAFISAINKAYKANIPAIDANSLPSVAQ